MGRDGRRLWVFGGIAGLVGAALGVHLWRSSESPSRQVRGFDVMMSAPDWSPERVERTLAASDEVSERLREKGEESSAEALRRRLETARPTEEELHSFYEANLDRFGQRSFEESRQALDQLVRIQRVRNELGAPAPENGVDHRLQIDHASTVAAPSADGDNVGSQP
jgi:hypothetical protein